MSMLLAPWSHRLFCQDSGQARVGGLSCLLLALGHFVAFDALCAAAWLKQDLSRGHGRIKMADENFVGRFGGGSWGRLNGADLDLLVGCVTGETLVYENTGTRTQPRLAPAKKLTIHSTPGRQAYPDGLRFTPEPGVLVTQWRCRPVVMDWDKDHLPDLITIDENGYLACYPRFRCDDGSLGLRPATYPFRTPDLAPLRFCAHPNPGRNGRIKLTLADWDGDGDLDIIRNGGSEDGTRNLDNGLNCTYLECLRVDEDHQAVFKWRGELTQSESIRLQGHSCAPVVVDVDGNGSLDIVSGCEDGNIYWFLREWIDSPQRFSVYP